jgi:hypothetical protein
MHLTAWIFPDRQVAPMPYCVFLRRRRLRFPLSPRTNHIGKIAIMALQLGNKLRQCGYKGRHQLEKKEGREKKVMSAKYSARRIGQEELVTCSSDYSTRWLAIK